MTLQIGGPATESNPFPVQDRSIGSAIGVVNVDVSSADQILATACRGFMIGTDGDVAVTMQDGSTTTFQGLGAGLLYPMAVSAFMHVGTTATGIKALL